MARAAKKEAVKLPEPSSWTVRVTDEWLPIPEAALVVLGWKEGDQIEVFLTHGQLIARKKGTLRDG